jgi:hypothetical protein
MSEYPVTTADDFKEFVHVPDSKGEPPIVIGGHAVNLWAMYYLQSEPGLQKLAPFTSKDMDFLGDRTTALGFSRMLNEPAERAPKSERTPVLYRIKRLFPNTDRQNSTLEVLSHLPGVSNREIKESAMLIHSDALGTRVRLPNPITCLKAKAHNLVHINQQKRQDHRQVQIMILCCRAFLRDVIAQSETGKITEGAARAPFEALLRWTGLVTARNAARTHNLRFEEAFPLVELERTSIPSLQQFFRKLSKRQRKTASNSVPGAHSQKRLLTPRKQRQPRVNSRRRTSQTPARFARTTRHLDPVRNGRLD